MNMDFQNGRFLINTDVSREEITQVLKKYEPWRHKIDFSCGISTADFRTFKPFNYTPSRKIQIVESKFGLLSGYRRALDVGCNAGYHSLYLAERYGMDVVGLDTSRRHISLATDIAKLAGVECCQFVQGNAETFRDPEGFDLILHFGTLYHLKNPVRAIETALANLRPGGLMLLETQVYGWWPWEKRALFINGLGGDKSNWWALGERVIINICSAFGARAKQIGGRYILLRRRRLNQSRAYFAITKDTGNTAATRKD